MSLLSFASALEYNGCSVQTYTVNGYTCGNAFAFENKDANSFYPISIDGNKVQSVCNDPNKYCDVIEVGMDTWHDEILSSCYDFSWAVPERYDVVKGFGTYHAEVLALYHDENRMRATTNDKDNIVVFPFNKNEFTIMKDVPGVLDQLAYFPICRRCPAGTVMATFIHTDMFSVYDMSRSDPSFIEVATIHKSESSVLESNSSFTKIGPVLIKPAYDFPLPSYISGGDGRYVHDGILPEEGVEGTWWKVFHPISERYTDKFTIDDHDFETLRGMPFKDTTVVTTDDYNLFEYLTFKEPKRCFTCGRNYENIKLAASEDSKYCVECGTGEAVVNGLCEVCPDGKTPSEDKSVCVECLQGYYGFGTGMCNKCDSGKTTYPGDGELITIEDCSPCPDGYETIHNNFGQVCAPCTGPYVGTGGRCWRKCEGRYGVNSDHTDCILCDEFQESDFFTGECGDCQPGRHWDGNVCADCGIREVSSSDSGYDGGTTPCESCPDSYVPEPRHCKNGNLNLAENGCEIPEYVPASCLYGYVTEDGLGCERSFDAIEPTYSPPSCTNGGMLNDAGDGCQEGEFVLGKSRCVVCEAGKYSHYEIYGETGFSNVAECRTCPDGSISDEGALACTNCASGFYQDDGENACTQCPSGYVSKSTPYAGNTECTKCEYPEFQGGSDFISCKTCGEGKELGGVYESVTQSWVYNNYCDSCAAGRYSDDDYSCKDCGKGSVVSANRNSCDFCERGKYSSVENNPDECTSCGSGKYSKLLGATHDSHCIPCLVGEYQGQLGQTECLTCPDGYTSSTTRSSCQRWCGPGERVSGLGCAPCEEGKYLGAGFETTCKECDNGAQVSEDQSHCVACPDGQYKNDQLVRLQGADGDILVKLPMEFEEHPAAPLSNGLTWLQLPEPNSWKRVEPSCAPSNDGKFLRPFGFESAGSKGDDHARVDAMTCARLCNTPYDAYYTAPEKPKTVTYWNITDKEHPYPEPDLQSGGCKTIHVEDSCVVSSTYEKLTACDITALQSGQVNISRFVIDRVSDGMTYSNESCWVYFTNSGDYLQFPNGEKHCGYDGEYGGEYGFMDQTISVPHIMSVNANDVFVFLSDESDSYDARFWDHGYGFKMCFVLEEEEVVEVTPFENTHDAFFTYMHEGEQYCGCGECILDSNVGVNQFTKPDKVMVYPIGSQELNSPNEDFFKLKYANHIIPSDWTCVNCPTGTQGSGDNCVSQDASIPRKSNIHGVTGYKKADIRFKSGDGVDYTVEIDGVSETDPTLYVCKEFDIHRDFSGHELSIHGVTWDDATSRTFTLDPGSYEYFCTAHPNMTGYIEVVDCVGRTFGCDDNQHRVEGICTACPSGKTSKGGYCAPCPDYHTSTGGTSCVPCPGGTGGVSCDQCAFGKFTMGGNPSSCETCPDGYLSTEDRSRCTDVESEARCGERETIVNELCTQVAGSVWSHSGSKYISDCDSLRIPNHTVWDFEIQNETFPALATCDKEFSGGWNCNPLNFVETGLKSCEYGLRKSEIRIDIDNFGLYKNQRGDPVEGKTENNNIYNVIWNECSSGFSRSPYDTQTPMKCGDGTTISEYQRTNVPIVKRDFLGNYNYNPNIKTYGEIYLDSEEIAGETDMQPALVENVEAKYQLDWINDRDWNYITRYNYVKSLCEERGLEDKVVSTVDGDYYAECTDGIKYKPFLGNDYKEGLRLIKTDGTIVYVYIWIANSLQGTHGTGNIEEETGVAPIAWFNQLKANCKILLGVDITESEFANTLWEDGDFGGFNGIPYDTVLTDVQSRLQQCLESHDTIQLTSPTWRAYKDLDGDVRWLDERADRYILFKRETVVLCTSKVCEEKCDSGEKFVDGACEVCTMQSDIDGTCKQCPAGKITDALTSENSVCMDCAPGFYSSGEEPTFVQGNQSLETSWSGFKCFPACDGYPSSGGKCSSECDSGYYNGTHCVDAICIGGTLSPVHNICICPNDYEHKNGVCEACPYGKIGNGITCFDCPDGKYYDAGTCKSCPDGYALGDAGCEVCPVGYTSFPSFGRPNCELCADGWSSYGDGNCVPCPSGLGSVNGICEIFYGCGQPLACNYNELANVDDGSCYFLEHPEPPTCERCGDDKISSKFLSDSNGNGVCDDFDVPGCTNTSACNYNEHATLDDGSCNVKVSLECDQCTPDGEVIRGDIDAYPGVCDGDQVFGCMYEDACNYNEDANVNTSCVVRDLSDPCSKCQKDYVLGGVRYSVFSDVDTDGDGVCDSDEIEGCTDATMFNYNPNATENKGCIERTFGCKDMDALNYNHSANTDFDHESYTGNESCILPIPGCMDPTKLNYNPEANVNINSDCIDKVRGCTDENACNPTHGANTDDGSCKYGYHCSITASCMYEKNETVRNSSCGSTSYSVCGYEPYPSEDNCLYCDGTETKNSNPYGDNCEQNPCEGENSIYEKQGVKKCRAKDWILEEIKKDLETDCTRPTGENIERYRNSFCPAS